MISGLKKTVLRYIFKNYVALEYPINPEPRYGEGKPPHPELAAMLESRDQDFLGTLTEISTFTNSLLQISESHSSTGEPYWNNIYFSALDAICLYGLLGIRKPQRYLEIGSGNSTKFARRAVHDLSLPTRIVSIDPVPRAEIDALCDEVIRQPLETVDNATFAELVSGDILFVDNSHQAFTNSDVTVFFLEILPRLKPGVLVHIHDIFIPFDYPGVWSSRHYSEQYLLASYLLAGCPWLRVLLPLAYISEHATLGAVVNNNWHQPLFQRSFARYRQLTGRYIGTSFWLEVC